MSNLTIKDHQRLRTARQTLARSDSTNQEKTKAKKTIEKLTPSVRVKGVQRTIGPSGPTY